MTRYALPDDASELKPFLVDLAEMSTPVNWAVLFGRPGPVEIEIGSGKALFLINAGGEMPDHNFLGIEISTKYARVSAHRVAKRDLRNVRILQTDARYFLRAYVPDDCVRAVHVYFPDPWWKKRHRKRRVFNPEMVQECQRVLEPGGRVHVVTDVPDYYDEILSLFKLHARLVCVDLPDAPAPTHDMDYLTNFERKFRQDGRPIYRVGYVKP